MFYNHAEETAKRRRQALSLGVERATSSERKSEGASANSSTAASSTLRGSPDVTKGGRGSSSHGSTAGSARPAWPPSHAEIVADAQSEGLLNTAHMGPKIPMWYRGPLLLAGKLELPSAKSRPTRGGLSSGGSGQKGDASDPSRRRRMLGLPSWISASSMGSTPTESDRDAGDETETTDAEPGGRGGHGSLRYTEREQAVIRKAMEQLEDGRLDKPFPGYENLSYDEWVQWLVMPIIGELQVMYDYRPPSGLDPRQRFSVEGGLVQLQRWVMKHGPLRGRRSDRVDRRRSRFSQESLTDSYLSSFRDSRSDFFDSNGNDSRRSRSLPPESGMESYGRSNSGSSFSSSCMSSGTSVSSRRSEFSRGSGRATTRRARGRRAGDGYSDTDDFRSDRGGRRRVAPMADDENSETQTADEDGRGDARGAAALAEAAASPSGTATSSSTYDERLSNRSWNSEQTWVTGSMMSGYPSDGELSSMVSSPGRSIGVDGASFPRKRDAGSRPGSNRFQLRIATPGRSGVTPGHSVLPSKGTPRFQRGPKNWLSTGGILPRISANTPLKPAPMTSSASARETRATQRRHTISAFEEARPGSQRLQPGAKSLPEDSMISSARAASRAASPAKMTGAPGEMKAGTAGVAGGRSPASSDGQALLARVPVSSSQPLPMAADDVPEISSGSESSPSAAGRRSGTSSVSTAPPPSLKGPAILSADRPIRPGVVGRIQAPMAVHASALSGDRAGDVGRGPVPGGSWNEAAFRKSEPVGAEAGDAPPERRMGSQSSWRWKSGGGGAATVELTKKIGPRRSNSHVDQDGRGSGVDGSSSDLERGRPSVKAVGNRAPVGGDTGSGSGGDGDSGSEPRRSVLSGASKKMPKRLFDQLVLALRDPGNRYRYVHLGLWVAATALMVLDRLLWNFWPRQEVDFCAPECGKDFYCPEEEGGWCLVKGPWSVKASDLIGRITGRVIISTTNLILATMCHGTWSFLAETKRLSAILRSWRDDNARLRSIGISTMLVAVPAHVYSLLLPSIFDGFSNEFLQATGITWPAEILPAEPHPRLDTGVAKTIWAPDDIVTLSWVTAFLILLGMLALTLRAGLHERLTFLQEGSVLCDRVQLVVGTVLLVETFRRRHHPHVWMLNGPVLLWFLGDVLYCRFLYRVSRAVTVTRIPLGSNHELLLWKKRSLGPGAASARPKWALSIGDICRLRHRQGPAIGRNGNPSATVVVFSPRCLSAQDAERIAGRGGRRGRGPMSRMLSGGGDDGQEHQDSFTSADYRDYCAKTSTVLGASHPGGSQSVDVFGTGGTFPDKPDEDDSSDRLSSSKHRGRRKRELLTRRADGDSRTEDSGTRTLSNEMTPTSHTLTSSSDVFDDRLTALGSSAADDEDDDGVFSGMPSFEDDDFSPKPREVHAVPTTEKAPPPPRGEVSSSSSLEGLCPIPGGYPVPGGGRIAGALNLAPLGEPAVGTASASPGRGSVSIVPAPVPPPAADDVGFLSSPTIDVEHGGHAAVEHEEVKADGRAAYEDDDIDGTDEEQVDVGLEGETVFLSADGGHLRSSLSSQLAPGFLEALGEPGFHSDTRIEVGESGVAAAPALGHDFAPPGPPSPRHARESPRQQALLPGHGSAASGKGPTSHQQSLLGGDPRQGVDAHRHPDTRFVEAFGSRGIGGANRGMDDAPGGADRDQWGSRTGGGDWGASATAADYKQAGEGDGFGGFDELGPGRRSAGGDSGSSSRRRSDPGGSGRRRVSRSGSGGAGGYQGSSDEEGIGKPFASKAAGLSSFPGTDSSAVGGGGEGGSIRRGYSRRSGGDGESDSSSIDRDSMPVASGMERLSQARAQRGLSDDAPRRGTGGLKARSGSRSERGISRDKEGRYAPGTRGRPNPRHHRSRSSLSASPPRFPMKPAASGAVMWARLRPGGRLLRVDAPAGEEWVVVTMDDGAPAARPVAPVSAARSKGYPSRAAVSGPVSRQSTTVSTVARMTLGEFFAGLESQQRSLGRDAEETAVGMSATPSEFSWALGSPTPGRSRRNRRGGRRRGRYERDPYGDDADSDSSGEHGVPGRRSDMERGLRAASPSFRANAVFDAATGAPPGAEGARGFAGAGAGVLGSWDCMAIVSVGGPSYGGLRGAVGGTGGAGAKGGGVGGRIGGGYGFGRKGGGGGGKGDAGGKGGKEERDVVRMRPWPRRTWGWGSNFLRNGLGGGRGARNNANDSIAMTSMTVTEANSSIAEPRRYASRVGGLTRSSSCSMSAVDHDEVGGAAGEAGTSVHNHGGNADSMELGFGGNRFVGMGARSTSVVDAYGPYESSMARLAAFPDVPPLLVVATGTGAGVLLAFAAHVAEHEDGAPLEAGTQRSVTVCYSSDSEPLLRLVTHALLSKKTPSVRIRTALSSPDAHTGQGYAYRYEDLVIDSLDMESIIAEASPDTEVFFCGEARVGREIQAACVRASLKYSGTYME